MLPTFVAYFVQTAEMEHKNLKIRVTEADIQIEYLLNLWTCSVVLSYSPDIRKVS
jgi:hypothetical protein